MTSIADIEIPVESSGLSGLFEAVPDLTVEMEQVIASNGHELWLSGGSHARIKEALETDEFIEEYTHIASGDRRWLYGIEFEDSTVDVFEMLLENGGTILNASASDGYWMISVRYVDREQVSQSYDELLELDSRPEIVRLIDLTEESRSHCGLTTQQYETLVAAIDHGYFEIPREVSMQELSDELGISHQALSERLRRAYRTLVATELDVSDDSRSTPSLPTN